MRRFPTTGLPPSLANVAFALAVPGEGSRARRLYDEAAPGMPPSPGMATLVGPTFEAILALRLGSLERVRQLFGPLEADELSDGIGTLIIWLRGEASLGLGRAAEAEAEFRKVLDHPEFSPTDVSHVLADVGMARARALAGDVAGARQAYERSFEIWQNAGGDIPILVPARAEYARLIPPG